MPNTTNHLGLIKPDTVTDKIGQSLPAIADNFDKIDTSIYNLQTDNETSKSKIGNLQKSNLEVISVKSYGAIGDGVTDDTAEIQAAIDAARTADTIVIFPSGLYITSAPLLIYDNTQIVGSGNAEIRGSHAGAIIQKSGTSTINNCRISDIILNSLNDNGILIDMDGISNSTIRRVNFSNSFDSASRKNKIAMRFQNSCYYNNIENCFIGGFNIAFLFDAVTTTGSNENNITGCNIRYNNTGVKINSLSNRETNAIRVYNNTFEHDELAIDCNGKYCVFIDNRYEDCTQAISLGSLSQFCEVNGGIFYGVTTPYVDAGGYNHINIKPTGTYQSPKYKYGMAQNVLLNPEFNNIVSNVPEYWTLTNATASIDTSFLSGARLLKLTIPISTSGTVSLVQSIPTNMRSNMVGRKYIKAVVYNTSGEITNIRAAINCPSGLFQSSAHPNTGWSALSAYGDIATVGFIDVQISMTAATTASRDIYIAFFAVTDYPIEDFEASPMQPYVHAFGGSMFGNLNMNKNKIIGVSVESGGTANRPTSSVAGQLYFDTDINQLISSTSTSAWITSGRNVGVPASATASGKVGDWASDASYLYVCHAANTWKRVAIATW